jgi:hypothetical protein
VDTSYATIGESQTFPPEFAMNALVADKLEHTTANKPAGTEDEKDHTDDNREDSEASTHL